MPGNRIAFLIDYLKQTLKEKNLTSTPKILVLWRLYVFPFIIREEQTVWEYEDWFAWSMNWKSRQKIQVFFWASIVAVLVTVVSDSFRPQGLGPLNQGILQARTLEWAAIPFPIFWAMTFLVASLECEEWWCESKVIYPNLESLKQCVYVGRSF